MGDYQIRRRIDRCKRYIKEHFGTQKAFGEAAGLGKSVVSRGLNTRSPNESSLERVEGGIFRLQEEGEIPQAGESPAEQIEGLSERITALARELREREG